jgi:hypothetical protein
VRTRVKGDFNVLKGWADQLKKAPALLGEMSPNMAEETVSLIRDGWRNQSDPYGDAWKPKKANDGRQILVGKTARLKGGWHVVKSARRGWTVAPSVDYAAPHQDPKPRSAWGGKSLTRRMMIPSRARGLPPAWSRAYREIAEETFAAHFGSRSQGQGIGFVTGKIVGLKRRFNAMSLLRKAMREVQGG